MSCEEDGDESEYNPDQDEESSSDESSDKSSDHEGVRGDSDEEIVEEESADTNVNKSDQSKKKKHPSKARIKKECPVPDCHKINQVSHDHHSYKRNLCNCVYWSLKKWLHQQGLNPWPRNTGASVNIIVNMNRIQLCASKRNTSWVIPSKESSKLTKTNSKKVTGYL